MKSGIRISRREWTAVPENLLVENEELPAGEVDQDIGHEETDEGGPYRQADTPNEPVLHRSAGDDARAIEQREGQELVYLRVPSRHENPAVIEPVDSSVAENKRDSGVDERMVGASRVVGDICFQRGQDKPGEEKKIEVYTMSPATPQTQYLKN